MPDELPQEAGSLRAVSAQCATHGSHRCDYSTFCAEGNHEAQRFHRRRARSGHAAIPMMQAADLWNGDNVAGAGGFDLSLDWRVSF